MKNWIIIGVAAVVLVVSLLLMKLIKTNDGVRLLDSAELIYEESISPNEDYVTDEADIVHYKIQVFQDKKYQIIVRAESNSAFFETVQYEVACDHVISTQDVKVNWMTLSGSSESTESDQYGLAQVSLSENGNIFNEKVISFFNKGIKAITDVLG